MNICCYRYFERQPSGNPNRVSNITDNSGSNLGYPNTSGSFTYDASGNQITYGAKGITSITYNHLNLPTKYTWSGSNLEIQYDAAGRKLKKIPSTGNAKTYVGGIEYSGTSIEAFYHSEGRASLISSTWEYEYAIRDHLGNSRVYFKYNGSITFLQVGGIDCKEMPVIPIDSIGKSHYYPYRMEQGGWTSPVSPENKYKYNGKEYNDEFALRLYDNGARGYDPAVGRWNSVDPMADTYTHLSPYNYVACNPTNYIDPDGMQIGDGKEIFNKFRNGVNNIINSLNDKAAKLNYKAEDARGAGNDKKAARIDARADKALSSASAYGIVASELNAIESPDQVYNLYINAGGGISDHAGGSTSYNTSSGAIDIKLKDEYNSNYLSHELKHAFQFESGRISFKSNGSIGDLYDLLVEQEAYQRGSLFGETRNPSLRKLASDYPAIKNNNTQRTLDTHAPFSDKSYREIFKMRAAANGGKGVSIKDVYKDPKY